MDPSVARRMWHATEPVHAVVYFAPEARDALAALGLKGFWMGYFASRAAPMGPVPAPVVTAAFYNFAPGMVAHAIPDAWSLAEPAEIVAARTGAATAALGRVLDPAPKETSVASAAQLCRQAAAAVGIEGRALTAACAALPWPDDELAVLWHATTLLREHRGDGHVAALLTEDIDGCEAHVLVAAGGAVPADVLRPNRGWSEDEWAAAVERLGGRGLVDPTSLTLTDAGRAARQRVEDRTDTMALAPWAALGDDGCARLVAALRPVLERIVATGAVPFPNPMGLPAPDGAG